LPNWVITDTRFENELLAIKKRDGICVRIDSKFAEKGDTHLSETQWRDWKFDYVLDNNGTLEELVKNTYNMLLHFNLFEIIRNETIQEETD